MLKGFTFQFRDGGCVCIEQRWWLGWNRKKKEETFSVQRLFSVSNFLIIIAFRSFLERREKQHIILRGAILFQKEIATQGGRGRAAPESWKS